MARNVEHGAALFRQGRSHAEITDASHDLGCDPLSIHHHCPPYQTRALDSAEEAIYKWLAYCAMSHFFFTLGANGKTSNFENLL